MTLWATVLDFVEGTADRLRTSTEPQLAALEPGAIRIERTTPIQDEEDVAIGLFMSFDRKEIANSTSTAFNQLPTMVVEIHARASLDEDTELWELEDATFRRREELIIAVEKALLGDPTWRGSAGKIRRFETQRSSQTAKTRPSYFAQLTIEPTFRTTYPTDPVHYVPLTQVDVNHDFAPPDGTVEIEQRIPLVTP